MLSTLPLEIILQIVKDLSFSDKLELVTTCRRISQIILQNSLYEEITIYSDDEILRFKNGQLNGRQVKHLSLEFYVTPDELLEQLSTIFPNVTRVFDFGHPDDPRPNNVLESLAKWKDTLLEFDVNTSWIFISELMETYTFSRLTTMTISPFRYYDEGLRGPRIRMFDCIKNVPSLKDLTLYDCEVNIDFMERLHSTCPNLVTLQFDYAVFLMDGERLPDSIESANSIKKLALNTSTVIIDRNGVLMNYIISKYKHITSFTFYFAFNELMFYQGFDNSMHSSLYVRLPQNMTSEMLVNGAKDTSTIYKREGGKRLLSKLPRTCTAVEIQEGLFDKPLEALIKSEMELTKLKLFDVYKTDYITGDPAHYLLKWNSLAILEIMVETNDYFSKDNIQLRSVKHLNLKVSTIFVEEIFYLDQVLVAFPCLESLRINSYESFITTSVVTKSEVSPCPTLSIVDIKAPFAHPVLLDYLLWVNPNIKKLGWSIGEQLTRPPQSILPVLTKGQEEKAENTLDKKMLNYMTMTEQVAYTIDLTGYSLNTLHLHRTFEYNDDNVIKIHLEIVIGTTVHHYKGMHDQIGPIRSLTKLNTIYSLGLKDTTRITIICKKLKRLVLDDENVITF